MAVDAALYAKLAPTAERCSHVSRFQSRPAATPKQRREARRAMTNALWAEAYRQGLTSFAVPPLFVSLLCRALWAVIMQLVAEYLDNADPSHD
jgi:hypothetical protein